MKYTDLQEETRAFIEWSILTLFGIVGLALGISLFFNVLFATMPSFVGCPDSAQNVGEM